MSKFTDKLEDIFDGDFVITHIIPRIVVLLPAVILFLVVKYWFAGLFDPTPREVW